MPVRIIPLSVLNAFKAVYENWEQSAPSRFSSTPDHRFLMSKYDLTAGGVEVLAFLLHVRPTQIAESSLLEILHYRNEPSMDIFQDLKDRKFIEERGEVGRNNSFFTVSDEAYSAFCNNKNFGMTPPDFDCYTELCTCSKSDLFSGAWLERFISAFECEKNRQYKEASQKLGLASLPLMAQKVFWSVARYFIDNFADVYNYDDVIENAPEVGHDMRAQLGVLAKAGLVILLPNDSDGVSNNEYILAPKAAGLLFHGHEEIIKYDELAKYADLIKCPDIEKKELFFSNDAQEEIDNLRKMISPKGFTHVIDVQSRKKRARSVVSLLWGPSGTGKTEVVKQLALESGRDVIKFDMSKVTGYAWGATEKYHRALFRAYNYVAVISENVPIFLLNEADDILSKRLMHMDRAIDKSQNTISNILLEEIEKFNGILLATTNLIDNIDPAFDRRFLFKTRLIKPDASARAKIWKSSIPELSKEEACKLAEYFDMSGAQIDNVVAKRDLAELYFDGDRGYDYIVKLCEKELSTEGGSTSSRSHIGF